MKATAALKAYAAAQAESEQLLGRLAKALTDHAAKAQAAPTNWGYAGDINHLNDQLRECLAAVGGLTSEERVLHRM